MFNRAKNDSILGAPQETDAPEQLTFRSQALPRTIHQEKKALIGKHVRINGDISFEGELTIEGAVNGDVVSSDPNASLIVEADATIDGTVEVDKIELKGIITGSIECQGLLTVAATGSVTGPIQYNQLTLEIGARIDGELKPVFTQATPFSAHEDDAQVTHINAE